MAQQGFLGEVRIFAGNFAPRSWAFCEGQLLPIAQNTALFSILGTIYGGDGRTTFALPDLRGRGPISSGTGPGLPSYREGQRGGNSQTTLTTPNLPSHNHANVVEVNTSEGGEADPNGTFLGSASIYAEEKTNNAFLGGVATGNTGNNTAFSNEPPYLGIHYIISIQGTFPSRN